jgi:hypothetical protein
MTEGGVARAVGAASIHPHLTACRLAADKMEWYLWTVAADSPSSSHWRYAASRVSAPSLLSRTLPQLRTDPSLDLALVLIDGPRSLVRFGRLEPLVEQLADRGRGPIELAGVHLRHKRRQRLAGALFGPDERLGCSSGFAGDRIVAGEGPQFPVAR